MPLPNTFQDNRSVKPAHAGFTLIEILVVIGLIALFAAVSALIGYSALGRSSVSGERDAVVLMLAGARARALANMDQQPQGVRIDNANITLFEGSSYPGTNQRTTPRNASVTVSPSPIDVIFDQLSAGVTAGAGTVTLTNGSQSYTVDINAQGRIEW